MKRISLFVAMMLVCCSLFADPDCKINGLYYNLNTSDKTAQVTNKDVWKDFGSISEYVKKYNLFVKGEQVTSDNCDDILGDGTVSYDEISNTLTLNNANITYDDWEVIAIYQDLVINCVGTNTLTTNSDSYSCIIEDAGNVTITGSGSLLVKSDGRPAIYTEHDLTIKNGCTITAQSANSNAIAIAGEALTVDNATLIAKGNGKKATISGCYDLVLNDAAITSAHTYDATTHQFLNAAGEEAKDEIVIKKRSLIDYNRICIDNISIENNSGEKVLVEGKDFGNLHAGSIYLFPFYLSLKNNADGNLPQGSQMTIVCSVNGDMAMLSLILNNELEKGSTLSFKAQINIPSLILKTGENSISFQVTKIIDDNNIEHTCTSDACIAHFYVNIQYSVKANAEDETKGSVTGGGYYDEGTDVTLTATPNEGYKFKEWSDGNTDNPRTFKATKNLTLTAIFEEVSKITISISATHGTVMGGGVYDKDAIVTLGAIPDEGYEFKEWSDGNTDNPRTFKATEDLTLKAIFVEITEGIDEVEDSQNSAATSSKFLQDGKLLIRRGNHIYDAQGKVVVNK